MKKLYKKKKRRPRARRPRLPGDDVALVVHRYDLQAELVDALRKTRGAWHLAARVENCHREFTHHVCTAGHHFAQPAQSCGVRICPFESRRRSMRMVHRIKNFVDRRRRRRYRYIVFSEPRCADLNEGILSAWRAWNNLRRDPFWQALVRGAVVVLEITYTEESGKLPWHPHLNVLCEGSFIPDDELRAAWSRASAGGLTARIEEADLGTIPELVKYVTKLETKKDGIDPETGEPYPATLLDSPPALDEFIKATRRRRFVRTYGTFYRMPAAEDGAHMKCPDCGCLDIVKLERLFPWQVGIDSRGHFRLTSTYLGANKMNGAGADRGG